MVALLSVRLSPGDKPTGLRLLGLVIGLGGVIALLGIDVAGRPNELLGAALVLLATVGYATAPIIVSRRLADLDPLGPVAASLTVSTVALLPAVFLSPPHAIPASGLWPHFSSCSSGRPSCLRFRRPSCQAGAPRRSRRCPASREPSRHSAACSCCSDCSPGRSPSSSRARWPSRISWAMRHMAFGRC